MSRSNSVTKELTALSATTLARMVREKSISPVEVVEAHIRRIEEVNPKLNALVTSTAEQARRRAKEAEAAVMAGAKLGPLHGVPYTLKDCLDTAGIRTTVGARLLSDRVPSDDATVAKRMSKAGGILLGKTNTAEMTMGGETYNLLFGVTRNPWNLERTAGGSSGGEAALIAAGGSPCGIGTDIGGSIRFPSNFCGVVGLRPTYGRIPMTGHHPWPAGPTAMLNSLGPIARRVEDIVLLFEILNGSDDRDVHSVSKPFADPRGLSLEGRSVVYFEDTPRVHASDEVRRTVTAAAEALRGRGAWVENLLPAAISGATGIWTRINFFDGGDGIREELGGGRPISLGAEWGRRLIGRATVTGSVLFYLTMMRLLATSPRRLWKAKQKAKALRNEIIHLVDSRGVLLCPVYPRTAPRHGKLLYNPNTAEFTAPFNVTGLPAAVVPCGQGRDGLPIGVQIVGCPHQEQVVLAAAFALEEAFGGWRPPPIA